MAFVDDWEEQRLCLQIDPILWETDWSNDGGREGKRACRTMCPVRTQCFVHTMESGVETTRGVIVAGLSAAQVKHARVRYAAAKAAAGVQAA